MIESSLEQYYNSTIHTRPLRVAYFICEGDLTAFERAATIATSRWGGLHDLIIPIRLGPERQIHTYFAQLLRLFEPDIFVQFFGETEDTEKLLADVDHQLAQLFPWRRIATQYGDAFEANDNSVHALGAIPPGAKGGRALQCPHVKEWSSAVNSALFGRIDAGQVADYAAELTIQDEDVLCSDEKLWELQFRSAWNKSPINLTTFHLSPLQVTGGHESNHFNIVFGESAEALCLFWNSRALADAIRFQDTGRRVLLCPIEAIETPDGLQNLEAFCRKNLAVLGIASSVHLALRTWTTEDYTRVSAVFDAAPAFVRNTADSHKTSISFGRELHLEDFSAKPLEFSFMRPTVPIWFRAGTGRASLEPTVWREGGVTPVRRQPVSGIALAGGNVAVDLECDLLRRFPRSHGVAAAIRQDGWFSQQGLTHIGALTDISGHEQYSTPLEQDAVTLWFQDRGYSIRRGAAGQYGETLVSAIGLEASDALASRQSYKLLHALAVKSSKKLARQILKLADIKTINEEQLLTAIPDLHLSDELKGVPRSIRQLRADPALAPAESIPHTLEKLVELGAVQRGLYLLCSRCGVPDWYPMRSLDEKLECSGCRFMFHVPLVHSDGTEQQFQLRLNTLFSRAMDQDVLPGVLALHHLTSRERASCRCLGLELLKGDHVEHEFDALFVSGARVYAVECKSSGGLGDKDIETALFAAQLGVKKFWFATTDEAWSADATERCQNLRLQLQDGGLSMTVGILTAAHLFGPSLLDGHLDLASH